MSADFQFPGKLVDDGIRAGNFWVHGESILAWTGKLVNTLSYIAKK